MCMNEFKIKLGSCRQSREESFCLILLLVSKRVTSTLTGGAVVSVFPLNTLQLVSETRCLGLGGPTPFRAMIIFLLLIVVISPFRGNV